MEAAEGVPFAGAHDLGPCLLRPRKRKEKKGETLFTVLGSKCKCKSKQKKKKKGKVWNYVLHVLDADLLPLVIDFGMYLG